MNSFEMVPGAIYMGFMSWLKCIRFGDYLVEISIMAAIMGASICTALFLFLFSVDSMFLSNVSVQGKPNYKEALAKSILFFQGQRSGRIPTGGDQQIDWRSDSGLSDGSLASVDLTGGYYDAGDNVKFNFPMAFTTTMLSWSVLDYRKKLGPELENAQTAIRWATDYLLKCATATPGKLYVGVGEPNADHRCWERPEDMDTPRNVYSVSASNPGSDVAAETAAALAAASMVFKKDDAKYSKLLLKTAKKVMKFAKKYRGAYSDKLCPFYCSVSGYKDELLWGAAWLYRATKKARYLSLIKAVATNDTTDLFSWDNKFAGARVLLAREFLEKNKEDFELFKQQAEEFMCRILPNSPSSSTEYTPGGLMYKLSAVNLQYVASISFLLSTYSKYMASEKHTFYCGNLVVKRHTLRKLAKKQVDYILGVNPLNMSYMVGFGENFPKRIHHRGSSLPSKTSQPQSLGCDAGYQFFRTADPNPNILFGAIVGGPYQNDSFADDRSDSGRSEPTTYTNAAIVGPLAHLAWSYFK